MSSARTADSWPTGKMGTNGSVNTTHDETAHVDPMKRKELSFGAFVQVAGHDATPARVRIVVHRVKRS